MRLCKHYQRLISNINLPSGRKDMNQPLRLTGFLNDLLDAVIFSERPEFPDELNLDAVFICNALGIYTNLFRKGLGERSSNATRIKTEIGILH